MATGILYNIFAQNLGTTSASPYGDLAARMPEIRTFESLFAECKQKFPDTLLAHHPKLLHYDPYGLQALPYGGGEQVFDALAQLDVSRYRFPDPVWIGAMHQQGSTRLKRLIEGFYRLSCGKQLYSELPPLVLAYLDLTVCLPLKNFEKSIYMLRAELEILQIGKACLPELMQGTLPERLQSFAHGPTSISIPSYPLSSCLTKLLYDLPPKGLKPAPADKPVQRATYATARARGWEDSHLLAMITAWKMTWATSDTLYEKILTDAALQMALCFFSPNEWWGYIYPLLDTYRKGYESKMKPPPTPVLLSNCCLM